MMIRSERVVAMEIADMNGNDRMNAPLVSFPVISVKLVWVGISVSLINVIGSNVGTAQSGVHSKDSLIITSLLKMTVKLMVYVSISVGNQRNSSLYVS